MKRRMCRLFFVIISAILIIQFSGCNGTGSGKGSAGLTGSKVSKTSAKDNDEYIYRGASVELNEDILGEFDKFEYYDDKVYFLSEYDRNGKGNKIEYYLNIAQVDGSGYARVLLTDDKSVVAVSRLRFTQDGTGYYIECVRKKGKRSYLLKSIDKNGKAVGELDITKAVTEGKEDLYPSDVCVSGNNIYIADYNDIVIVNKKGKLADHITSGDMIEALVADPNGDVYAYLYNGSGFDFCKVDLEGGKLEDSLGFPFEGYSGKVFNGSGKIDFLVNDGTSLYRFDADGKKSEILNWIASGISILEVTDVFCTEDDKLVCAGKSYPSEIPKFSVLTEQPKPTEEKAEIILAGTEYSITPLLEHNAVKFNGANDKYYITVKKYSYDNQDQLNLDITSGHVPDILISDSYLPIDVFIAKGIFADLYEFIDSDSELSRDDFVSNLLEACETDGKLYRFTNVFKISTVLGKTSIFGETMGVTVDEVKEILKKFPEGTELLPGSTKDDILRTAMELSGSSFMDYEKGICSFDSDAFIKLLEYANTYMDSLDYDKYFDDSFWKRAETMYIDDNALLSIVELTDYADIYRFEHTEFGESVTAVGFPCEGRVGTAFVVDTAFSISEKSKYKEGAWEFLRELLLPDQDFNDCFSVRKDLLEKSAQQAMKPDKDRMNYAVTMIGQMMISSGAGDIGEPKKKDIAHMDEVIASADGLMDYDQKVIDIILEEAASYFGGSKSAQEAAKLIQTRVQLYLDEKS